MTQMFCTEVQGERAVDAALARRATLAPPPHCGRWRNCSAVSLVPAEAAQAAWRAGHCWSQEGRFKWQTAIMDKYAVYGDWRLADMHLHLCILA